jgi:hypothetical protein
VGTAVRSVEPLSWGLRSCDAFHDLAPAGEEALLDALLEDLLEDLPGRSRQTVFPLVADPLRVVHPADDLLTQLAGLRLSERKATRASVNGDFSDKAAPSTLPNF